MLDEQGRIVRFVALQRAVTPEREMAAERALDYEIQAKLTAGMRNITDGATLEQTAEVICAQLVTLPFVDLAWVEAFLEAEGVEIVGLKAPGGFPIHAGDRLPPETARGQRRRAVAGPWSLAADSEKLEPLFREQLEAAGVTAIAYGPLVRGDHEAGGLLIGTRDAGFARSLVEKRLAIASIRATASGLLVERLHARRVTSERRAGMRALLAGRAFHPVFQPIVDLATRQTVAYEALTRFDSGQQPDRCFADAWELGLGRDLELATLAAALDDAQGLPPGGWLNLNVSPRLLSEPEPEPLKVLLWRAKRPIVLEITEHEVVADYEALRATVRGLGRDIRLAVDDAGVGVANFGHIVDLSPDFVKLDISLVRRVNAHLGRQALVVAMTHFSRTAGCRLVAEGVETEEEAATLLSLGVEFGQGFLFGRPSPIAELGRWPGKPA
jgi:EAL domain-containing protein (putative c-di-GMP-specific phosphodiesterase class I)